MSFLTLGLSQYQEFVSKIRLCHFPTFMVSHIHAKVLEKSLEPFSRKAITDEGTKEHTDRRTNRGNADLNSFKKI